jgi:hypothetical protein
MERTIGNLGQEIRQPSNPFANLARRALRRSQVNALKSIYPKLDPKAGFHLPKSAVKLGNGYIMLRPRDRYPVQVPEPAADILSRALDLSKIRRWGRVRLPNGQVARSLWSEKRRTSQKVRVSRNVKVWIYGHDFGYHLLMHDKMLLNRQIEYGEVQFYFLLFATEGPDASHAPPTAHALVSVYTRPIQDLLDESSNTLWACQYTGNGDLRVVDISTIVACVSMQPLPPFPNDPPGLLFVLEKSGLEDFQLTGFEEPIDLDNDSAEL